MKRIITTAALALALGACSSLSSSLTAQPQPSHLGCAGGEDATHLWHNQKCLESRT